MSSAVVQVRMDTALRDESAALFEQMGFDLPTAIRMFLTKAVQEKALPFKLALPKKDSKSQALEAMRALSEEARRNGTADMTLDEINAEIAAVRAERKARRG